MLRSLYTAATGMDAQQTQMDTIANNLANASTTAYKSQRPEFEDLFYDTVNASVGVTNGSASPGALEIGLGVRAANTTRALTQGSLSNTGNPLDLAVQGQGYFRVQMPDGTLAYTRAGNLALDQNGHIVTQDGLQIQPTITVPPTATAITIQANGAVFATLPTQTQPQSLGTMDLAMFMNPNGLQSQGGNLFTATQSSGEAQVVNPGLSGSGTILQGSLEASNVNAVTEMVNMISAQRAYELSSKVIQTADQMLQKLTSLR